MKKTYTRPELNVEYFSLTQNVASGCGALHNDELTGGPTHWSKTTCGWRDSWGDVYWTTIAICGTETPEDAEIEGVCYNNPNGGHTIFSS